MNARKVLALSAVGFSVALAVVVGNRMSAEAMAVVIGVVCGVMAGIPMSAVLFALSRRTRPVADESPAPAARLPLLVMAPAPTHPPAVATWPGYYAPQYPAPAIPAPREFRIVGDE